MKQNIILDLDNTIISAEALEDFPFDKEGMREKALNFAIHDMDSYYIVFERPNLQEFLDWLFEHYNINVWTAATKDYALFIIKEIILRDSRRKLDYIFFSHHCDISKKKYKGVAKNLQLLWDKFEIPHFNRNNTLIIDDLDTVYKPQKDNAILIKAFEILDDDSEKDDELMKNVKKEIKNKFSKLSAKTKSPSPTENDNKDESSSSEDEYEEDDKNYE